MKWTGLLVAVALAGAQPATRDTTKADSMTRPAWTLIADGSVRVTAKTSPRSTRRPLTVGDRFEVDVTVIRPRDIRPSPPFNDGTRDFVLLDQKLVTRLRGDSAIDEYRLTMTGFATGELVLPPFRVAWQRGTELLAAQSESVRVTIASVLPENMVDINQLKPQVRFPDRRLLCALVGLVVALGLGYLAWRILRRYRRAGRNLLVAADPWDEALACLDSIPGQEWLDHGWHKKYYYAVSEILKRYLTRRFGFPAMDQTTTEVVRELKQARVENRDRFAEFFYRADMVKYAKLVPPRTEADAVVDKARELVRETMPPPAGNEPADGAR